jgi:outer membrane immunogenic protein
MKIQSFAVVIAAGAGLMCAVTTASADGPRYGMKDAGPYERPFSWTGLYVGVTAGGAQGETRFADSAASNPFDIDGINAGTTIGYNLQLHRNLVVGVEADFSFSHISGSFGPGELGQPNGDEFSCVPGACTTDVNWFGTVRGRIGYAVNSVLIYGTGGLAYGRVKSQIETNSFFQARDTNVGWTAGGGVEYPFAPGWSAKVEYLHVDLGSTEKHGVVNFKSDVEFDVVRAGLNYRFGK